MTYGDKLKDPRWQKKRLLIMDRDEWKCKVCMATDNTLNVHHIDYNNDPWDATDDKLITLCEKCHEQEERLLKNFPLAKASKSSGVLMTDFSDLIIAVFAWADRVNKSKDNVSRSFFIRAIELINKQNG